MILSAVLIRRDARYVLLEDLSISVSYLDW